LAKVVQDYRRHNHRTETRLTTSGLGYQVTKLVHCNHALATRVSPVAPTRWCDMCGAVYDGTRWIRPRLHTPLLDQLKQWLGL
jgi:hypothetical protein